MNLTDCAAQLLQHLEIEFSNVNYMNAALILCKETRALYSQGMLQNSTVVSRVFHGFCCNKTTALENLCGSYLKDSGIHFKCTKTVPNLNQKEFIGELAPFDSITYILMALLVPIGLIGNLLILYAIVKLKCLPRQTGYFLSSLALADIGVIIQYMSFFVYHKSSIDIPWKVEEFLLPSFDILVASISLLQITLISVERAVAVTWPLKYPSLISVKRAKRIVLFVWLMSFFLFVFSLSRIFILSRLYKLVHFYITVTILLFIPIVVIMTSYTFVLICAYKNLSQDRQRIRMLTLLLRSTRDEQHTTTTTTRTNSSRKSAKTLHIDATLPPTPPTTETSCNDSNTSSSDSGLDKNTKRSNWKFTSVRCREIKLAVNVAMIVLPFLGCWGYFLAANMYEVIKRTYFKGVANWMITTAPFMVSCLNPVLYLTLTRSLRKAVKSLIKRNVKSKLSRTELSMVTISTMNSRRTSTIMNLNATNRKIGREYTVQKDTNSELGVCLMKLDD